MQSGKLKNQFLIIYDYCKASYTKVVVASVGMAVTQAVRPFVTMVLLGYLLDAIYAGVALPKLLQIIAVALVIECLCYCLNSIFSEMHNQRDEYMYEQQNGLLNQRLLTMDYEHLENPKVHAMVHSIRNAGTDHGLIGVVLEDWNRLLESVVAIVTAIVIAIPLFTQTQTIQEGFLGSWVASLILFLMIGILVYWSFQVDIHYGARIRETHKARTKHENMLEYYMNIFETSERQKDLRINHQNALIEKQTSEASDAVCKEIDTEANLAAREEIIRQTATALIGLLVYLFAGMRAYMGLITIGGVVAYASGIIRMSECMAEMMNVIASIRSHMGYCDDYAQFRSLHTNHKQEDNILLNENAIEKQISALHKNQKQEDTKITIEFDHVSFRYPGTEQDVIHDLSVTLTQGDKIAIVGKNGSGKSTFIKLLCRLYEVTQGCIRINGKDIREYSEQEYESLLAVVFQDFKVFAFALGENIASSESVDERKCKDAIKKAGLQERYESLTEGMHTFVGNEYDAKGVNFSGGERQKIAIARAIYKDAPLVIMDEPTAALDPVSECEIFAGFDQMVGEKTAMYISHRLASCRFCKDILVFDEGKVIQRGNHEELVKQEGLYQKLWNAQAQYYA